MSVDFRPTADAPDDDPYLWLEEVEGERARPGSTRRTRAPSRRSADRRSSRTPRRSRRSSTGPTISRFPAGAATVVVQFLERRGAPARAVAAHDAPRASATDDPQWEVLLDLDALAARRGRGLDLERRRDTARHTRPRHREPVARRQRCGRCCASSTSGRRPSCRRLRAHRGQGRRAAWLDRDTLLLASARGGAVTTSGYARTVRLWRRGTKPDEAPVLFEVPADRHVGVGRRRPHRSRASRSGSTTRSASSTCRSGWRPQQARPARPADRRRASMAPRLARGQAAQGLDRRRPHLARRFAARHPARRLPRRRPRLRRCCSSRRAAARAARISRGTPAGWSCRSPTTSMPVFEVLTPGRAGWARTSARRPAATSAWSMSGRSTSRPTEANGDLLASTQDPLTPPRPCC